MINIKQNKQKHCNQFCLSLRASLQALVISQIIFYSNICINERARFYYAKHKTQYQIKVKLVSTKSSDVRLCVGFKFLTKIASEKTVENFLALHVFLHF